MSANRTVADLAVKSIVARKRGGNSWVRPPEAYFVPGVPYKLEVVFGNTGGRIQWQDEQYRKDNVDIRIVAMGFGGTSHKDKVEFFVDQTLTTKKPAPTYRTTFHLDQFETTNADVQFEAYFEMASGTPTSRITTFRWDVGIYASVRDKVWRKPYTSV